MAKVKKANDGIYLIECPGCECDHGIDSRWTFNGDFNKPTFTPSLNSTIRLKKGTFVCHSYVTDGKIQYLPDTTHKYSGQTIELPDYL